MNGSPRYALIACHVLWRELSHLAATSPGVIFPVYLEQGLHNEPDRLRSQVQAQIDRLDGQFDAILLGYGLCSNGICGLVARRSPLVVIRAHDCITLLLGAREHYQAYFAAHPGTYWYSAGWIETTQMPGRDRMDHLRRQYAARYDEETAEYLLEEEKRWIKNYSRACFIKQDDLPGNSDLHRAYTRRCAADCGWQYDELPGRLDLLRALVHGCWDSERFLVTRPGQKIQAAYDQSIIAAGDDD
jgi:hypothetical protein